MSYPETVNVSLNEYVIRLFGIWILLRVRIPNARLLGQGFSSRLALNTGWCTLKCIS